MRQKCDTGDHLIEPDKTPFPEPFRCGVSRCEGDYALQRQIEACRAAWEGGEPLALAEATNLIYRFGWTMPEWLVQAWSAFAIARRTPAEAECHRERMRHALRYLAVRDLRREGFNLASTVDALAPRPAVGRVSRPEMPGMRPVVAAIDYQPRLSGGGYKFGKQTPRPAAVASPMGHNRSRSGRGRGRTSVAN